MAEFKMEYREPKTKTKRCMATAHLIAKIVKETFDNGVCELIPDENEQEKQLFSTAVLDNLIIVGGLPRDILLNTESNDLDIVFNLRELTKLQYNHLIKYHNSPKNNSQNKKLNCIYWQLYLNKFNNDNDTITNFKDKSLDAHNYNFIFNAKFIVSILLNSKYFKNKLSMKNMTKSNYFTGKIISELVYNGINLEGQKIDIIDSFDHDKILIIDHLYNRNENETNQKSIDLYHKKQRQKSLSGLQINDKLNKDSLYTQTRHHLMNSMQILSDVNIQRLADEFNNEDESGYDDLIEIDIPIYSDRTASKICAYDFSIDTVIIPLSSIIYKNENENFNYNWTKFMQNGIKQTNGIEDITINKILKVPINGKELFIVQSHPITFHWFRCIRFRIKFKNDNFRIDPKLIKAYKLDYIEWLDNTWFNRLKNRLNFMKKLSYTIERFCINIDDVQLMLEIMDKLEFHEKFINIIKQNNNVKIDLINTIGNITKFNTNDIIDAFKLYNYPFDNIDEYNNLKQQLKQKIDKQDELMDNIQELKDVNDQLLKQINYMQQNKINLIKNFSQAMNTMRDLVLNQNKNIFKKK